MEVGGNGKSFTHVLGILFWFFWRPEEETTHFGGRTFKLAGMRGDEPFRSSSFLAFIAHVLYSKKFAREKCFVPDPEPSEVGGSHFQRISKLAPKTCILFFKTELSMKLKSHSVLYSTCDKIFATTMTMNQL